MSVRRIRGYPLSQLVISGGITLCIIALMVFVKSKDTAAPLPVPLLAFAGMMVAVALYSVLTYPFVTMEIDAGRSEVIVRWSWLFGFIARPRSISFDRIEKTVYSVTNFGGTVTRSGENTMAYSKQSFYLSLKDGGRVYVLPLNRANRRLARKFACELKKHLEMPVVLRTVGQGTFDERPFVE